MTFAPMNRKVAAKPNHAAPYGKTKTSAATGRTGVTFVSVGRSRTAVATIRQGDSLVYLGSGTVEDCNRLFEEAKAKQQEKLSKLERAYNG